MTEPAAGRVGKAHLLSDRPIGRGKAVEPAFEHDGRAYFPVHTERVEEMRVAYQDRPARYRVRGPVLLRIGMRALVAETGAARQTPVLPILPPQIPAWQKLPAVPEGVDTIVPPPTSADPGAFPPSSMPLLRT